MANDIPMCPLVSIGTGIDMVCSQDRCAWYLPNVKKCSVYMIAYDSMQNINERQRAKQLQK